MTLIGPHAEDCYEIIECALLLSHDEALVLSVAYETDPNEHYYEHCAVVQDALGVSGRTVEAGWLEAAFAHLDWVHDTHALHAIADAVMAVLVADIIPSSVVCILARPWLSLQVRADLIVGSS